ncbi:uncharacterized protein LOC143911954 [Arctopsyche grandis]|uniref:uncharacterized protein LOC143911954 n=1 Tax=Arctopsyche grandis TaxID=121162 RepID=UPI00406D6711
MNCAVLCLALSLATWSQVEAQNQEGGFYDSRYDYLDVDTILDNKRLVRNYVDCLLNEKPCTAEGKQLRRILPEGLRTKCARCTPRQKHNALAILSRLQTEHPKDWERLAARWDPTGDYTRRFKDYLEKDDNNRISDEKPFRPSPPRPAVLNRFGPDVDEIPSPSEINPTIRSISSSTTMRVTSSPSTFDEMAPSTTSRPTVPTTTPKKEEKPTTRSTTTVRPKQKLTTKKPIEYPTLPPPVNIDLTPIYAGTMGLIDHFGNKIIRTTEFVTDILRNTVRVVVGPHAGGRN